jgi:endo-1,4-beta-xylanase
MQHRRVSPCFTVLAAIALVASCGAPEDETVIEADAELGDWSEALTVGQVVTYEAEVLARTASAAGSQVTSETGASGGRYVQLSGTPAIGAWVQFTLNIAEAGSYDLKLLYKSNSNRGIVQASVDGANQGSVCNQYATTATQQVSCSLGNKALTAGNHTIRFTVTGKSSSSTGYMVVIDQLALTATSGGGSTCTATTLKEAAACKGRLIGTTLEASHLGEAAYANAAREFNYATPGNEMKWDTTEPNQNQFSYGPADQIVNFATSNGMKVKGHTLVWHSQLPNWVNNMTNATTLRAAMTNHVTKVMQHYKGKVHAWDVVNEAWDDTNPPTLRESVFKRVLGSSYIDDAFIAARAADPAAKLYYNDYATDGLSAKSNSVYSMVQSMKSRGIPIDGVGIQMHWRSVGSTLTPAEVISNIQRFAALGVEVVISEMDVQLCRGGTLTDQQARYHDIVAACLSQGTCPAVTIWGITDKYSWLNSRTDLGCTGGETPRPLLWDNNYGKKLAYTGVMDALLGR